MDDLSLFDVGGLDSRTNPFKEEGNDRGATNPSNDSLHGIEGLMTRSKTKKMKLALQDLILNIKKKEDQCELRVVPNWVTFLQIDEDALRPT